jgi:hypothetical protein
LLNPCDNHIASGLNTTHKNNTVFYIFFVYMGRAHGFKLTPFAGHNPHTADSAASAAAPVIFKARPVADHPVKHTFVIGAVKNLARVLYGDPVFPSGRRA